MINKVFWFFYTYLLQLRKGRWWIVSYFICLSKFGFWFFKLKWKTKTNFKFEFQFSVVLKIEKPCSFVFYVSTLGQKQKSKLYSLFLISFFNLSKRHFLYTNSEGTGKSGAVFVHVTLPSLKIYYEGLFELFVTCIPCHWFVFIPPGNIRKPWFFFVFKCYRKRPVALNGSTCF